MEIPTAAVAGVPDPLPEGLLVLDVREDAEWAAGHVAGSVHVPLMDLGQRYAELTELFAADQTLVVCRSGNRSAYAVGFLVQQGIDAVNLEGGLLAWEATGRALVADGDAPAMVV
ncbi:MAG TPA: rhodanese-like domain-containing protein [Nocardioides sp.]|jgi:rhodanese-related sulfurtransferase|uniref:rhodanese-like domain-containing protein n=1 Tax=Nocardioides sp. TaxID=35761 RepID=UPI002E309327|nr:rhodanese-like domain-containing protein [Nocardioides sp.]HEX3932213.1 rhodanese-like domain-containing protein [Nocardioides sp.]